MPKTPDRTPGPRIEEKITLTSDEVLTADIGGDMVFDGTDFSFRDTTGAFNPRTGGGITEAEHEALDTLVHALGEDSYTEYTLTGIKPTSVITWTTSGKTLKIRERTYTWTGNKVTQIVTVQYNGSGVATKTITEALSYTSGRLTSIERTIS